MNVSSAGYDTFQTKTAFVTAEESFDPNPVSVILILLIKFS